MTPAIAHDRVMLNFRSNVSPADWITCSDTDWRGLALFGPPAFDAYARLLFMPDPDHDHQTLHAAPATIDHAHAGSDARIVIARACAALAEATTTPDHCYFATWDGYSGVSAPLPGGCRMHIPNRSYHLYDGALTDAEQWRTPVAHSAAMFGNPPAFVWPADHAWCIACDTDPHWAGIGASVETIQNLASRNDIDVVTTDRTAPQPFYWS